MKPSPIPRKTAGQARAAVETVRRGAGRSNDERGQVRADETAADSVRLRRQA